MALQCFCCKLFVSLFDQVSFRSSVFRSTVGSRKITNEPFASYILILYHKSFAFITNKLFILHYNVDNYFQNNFTVGFLSAVLLLWPNEPLGGSQPQVHSFIFLFSTIIKQFNTKIINIKKIIKRKNQHNVRR